jgi:hypothetical protein
VYVPSCLMPCLSHLTSYIPSKYDSYLVSSVEVVVGKNTTPLLTDAQPLLSGQVLMFVNYNGHTK